MSSMYMGLPTLYKTTVGGDIMEWTIGVWKTRRGTGIMVTAYGLQGGKRQVLREEITEGKNLGKKNETSPHEQAVLEAEARWRRQRDRKGYGETAAESARVRKASPMLAQVYDKQARKVNWDTAFAQPKLDGFRALVRRDGRKAVITSRENLPMPAVQHVADILATMLDDGVVLDGEMYGHGLSLNQISSACKKKSALTEKIQYHVFDTLMDVPFAERSRAVSDIVEEAGTRLVRAVMTVKVRSESELMIAQREFLQDGYEGAMLRHGAVGYEAGKRSSALLKVKSFQDDEFVVSDWKMGRGKYAGMPIFTCTTPDGNDFDVLAPGNLEEKRALGERAHELVGKKLTVKYQYLTRTDEPVPFLPVARRFRE